MKLRLWQSSLCKQRHGGRNSDTETLHVSQGLHGVGKIGVSVIGDSRASKVLLRDLSEWPSRALNLDSVPIPRDPCRRVRRLIGSVHDRVPNELLKRGHWIAGISDLAVGAANINADRNRGTDLFVNASNDLGQPAINAALVDYVVGKIGAVNSQELHAEVRKVVERHSTQGHHSQYGRRGVVGGSYHFQRGKAFLNGPFIGLKHFWVKCRGQVFLLEHVDVQAIRRHSDQRSRIERHVKMPAPFAQNSLILCCRNSATRSRPDMDAAAETNWRRKRRLYGHHCELHAGHGSPLDQHGWWRGHPSIRLHCHQRLQRRFVWNEGGWCELLIFHADKYDSRFADTGQIVGECTNGFTNGVSRVAIQRLLHFDAKALAFPQQAIEIFVGKSHLTLATPKVWKNP